MIYGARENPVHEVVVVGLSHEASSFLALCVLQYRIRMCSQGKHCKGEV